MDDFRQTGAQPGKHTSEEEYRAWRSRDPLPADEEGHRRLAREVYAFASEEVRHAHGDATFLHDSAIAFLSIIVRNDVYQSEPPRDWSANEMEMWKRAWRYTEDADEATRRLRQQIRGELAGWGSEEPLAWPWREPMPGMEEQPLPEPLPPTWTEALAGWWRG